MHDDLNIVKQAANNISEDEPVKKEVDPNAVSEERKGLGSFTKRNYRPGESGPGSASAQRKRYYRGRGRKICHFCAKGVLQIDYKDAETLKRYTSLYGKIMSRRQTGNCASHQRHLANSIKRARIVALLPFVRE